MTRTPSTPTPATPLPYPPGPYRAERNTIKSISHGVWSTAMRCESKAYTEEGRFGTAAYFALAGTEYPRLLAERAELVAALRKAMHGVECADECREIQDLLVKIGEIR